MLAARLTMEGTVSEIEELQRDVAALKGRVEALQGRMRDVQAGLFNGPIVIITSLVRELEDREVLPAAEFAARLLAMVEGRDMRHPRLRLDLLQAKQTAELLLAPRPKTGWDPRVIEGGLSLAEEPENSDPPPPP
jgi:hypothetical protein